jgi:23S rRNA-/tRNA-specific pseudouridylate synthase
MVSRLTDPGMDGSSETLRFTVGNDEAGARLDVLIAKHVPVLSRSRIQKEILGGKALLNGKPARKNAVPGAGDRIEINIAAPDGGEGGGPVAQDMALSVLYEDEHLMAIDAGQRAALSQPRAVARKRPGQARHCPPAR